jgi:hypothetical protein
MDDVQFTHPMRIGSTVEFEGKVLYAAPDMDNIQACVVQVRAFRVDHASHSKTQTNTMTFIFKPCAINNEGKSVLLDHPNYRCQSMPRQYDEVVLWLEGRRVFERLCLKSDVDDDIGSLDGILTCFDPVVYSK